MAAKTEAQRKQQDFAATVRSLVMIRSQHLYPLIDDAQYDRLINLALDIELVVRDKYRAYQKVNGSKHLTHKFKTRAQIDRDEMLKDLANDAS